MKRFLRLVSLTLLIMSTSGNTFAEEKVNVARQGTIRGRIVDTSKQILPGASIYIEKLHTGVTSDVNDFYKVPITVAFLVSSCYAIAITRGLTDRKSTRLNSSHTDSSRMPSSA